MVAWVFTVTFEELTNSESLKPEELKNEAHKEKISGKKQTLEKNEAQRKFLKKTLEKNEAHIEKISKKQTLEILGK